MEKEFHREGLPSGNFAAQFESTDLLKEARGIRTFRGREKKNGAEVIIKHFPGSRVGDDIRARLVHDIESLNGIGAPGLRSLSQFHCDATGMYLVAPFISGVSLAERLRQGSLGVSETLRVAQSVFAALQQAHARHIVHGDIKPADIILDSSQVPLGVTLVDFGSARGGYALASLSEHPYGTLAYVSPEQAGLSLHRVDERSDLYSAGAVLYECVTGRPPFLGIDAGEVLRQLLSIPPADPRSLGACLPRSLSQIIARLLAKDPSDRYQSASAVVMDLATISSGDAAAEPVALGQHDPRRTLTDPAFVGRDESLGALQELVAAARNGQGGIVLVEGASGAGKSRLFDELAAGPASFETTLYRGAVAERGVPHPFEIFSGLVDRIRGLYPGDEFRHKISPEDRNTLSAVLPEWGVFTGATGDSAGESGEEFGETRTLRALSALMGAMGRAGRPAVFLLDDCQWADEMTLKLFRCLATRSDLGNWPVLVVMAFRTEEFAADHWFRQVPVRGHLSLAPLTEAAVHQLLQSMAGPLPDIILNEVTRLSGGSPFMASALLLGLVEGEALRSGPRGWLVRSDALDTIQSSRDAAEIIRRRFEWLPAFVHHSLQVAAVVGQEFESQLIAELINETPEVTESAFGEACRRHILWTDEKGKYRFVHAKLREALLETLPQADLRALHARTASAIERIDPGRIYELAYHFDAAGDPSAALPYALTAAQEARERCALEISERHYRIAERGASDKSTRRRVVESLGEVLMLRGRYAEAEERFSAIRGTSEDGFERARLAAKIGELQFKRGNIEAAIPFLKEGLTLLGWSIPTGRIRILPGFAKGLLEHLAHRWIHRRRPESTERDRLVIRLLTRLGYCYWYGQGRLLCLWMVLRTVSFAERFRPSEELAYIYSGMAPAMTLIPWYAEGIRYAEKSLAIRKQLGNVWGQGQSLHFWGVVLYARSQFEECVQKCEQAVEVLERTGDRWEANIAALNIAYSHYRMGDLDAAVGESRRIYRQAVEIGDIQSASNALSVWAKSSAGEVPREYIVEAKAGAKGDAQTLTELNQALALNFLARNDLPGAVRILEETCRLIRERGLASEYARPTFAWLVTALRLGLEKRGIYARSGSDYRRARKAARKALRMARRYRNNLPHVLRECGLIEAIRGRSARARKYFDEGLAVSLRQKARLEHAQTLLARARIGREFGWKDLADDGERAHALFGAKLGEAAFTFALDGTGVSGTARPPTLSLFDRFSKLLEAGRRIASSLSREKIFSVTRAAAIELLRAERCVLVDGLGNVLTGDGPVLLNEPLIRRALAEAAPVVLSVSAEKPFRFPGSALAVRLVCGTQNVGVLYADHRREGIFGDEEKRLAEFIAAIAGAALENVGGVEATRRQADLLLRSNAELERFAFVASHDLQEPLHTLTLYTQWLERLLEGRLEPETKEVMDTLTRSAAAMRALISDLLSYSRLNRVDRSFEPVDSNVVVGQAIENLEASVKTSGAQIRYERLPTVVGIQAQLVAIFQNLIGNAIKFRSEAPPQIRITATGEGSRWRFAIQDNGIGFESRYAEQIFVPFKRLHTEDVYPGTGMGLAICRRAVEWHGGRIWAESEPGKGATFFFTLGVSSSSSLLA